MFGNEGRASQEQEGGRSVRNEEGMNKEHVVLKPSPVPTTSPSTVPSTRRPSCGRRPCRARVATGARVTKS